MKINTIIAANVLKRQFRYKCLSNLQSDNNKLNRRIFKFRRQPELLKTWFSRENRNITSRVRIESNLFLADVHSDQRYVDEEQ